MILALRSRERRKYSGHQENFYVSSLSFQCSWFTCNYGFPSTSLLWKKWIPRVIFCSEEVNLANSLPRFPRLSIAFPLTHPWFDTQHMLSCYFSSLTLSLSHSFYLSLTLYFFFLSLFLSFSLSLSLSLSLSIDLSTSQFIYLYLSIYIILYMYIYIYIYISSFSSELCPRAGTPLQTHAPKLQFCLKAGVPPQTQEPRLQFN